MSLISRTGGTLWRVVFAAAVIVHLLALYLPAVPAGVQVEVVGADKVVHVLVFAAVMGTGLMAGIPLRWLVPAMVAHAVVSEAIQHLALPGRAGEWLDVVANLGGVVLGWYLASVASRRRLTSAGPAPSADARSGPSPSIRR